LLETPSIRRYSFVVTPLGDHVTMSSDNPTGADDQQERPGAEEWSVGFVDGEGCFSPSRSALELLIEVFGCGRIIENHRTDNHRLPLLRFIVKRRRDLMEKVVPFFEERPLRTAKQLDFERFALVLRYMDAGGHLSERVCDSSR
jgi:LAGLIDADG endonuclease